MRIDRRALAFVVPAIFLIGAACSDDGDDTSSEDQTTTTTVAPESTADDADSAESPETVVDVAMQDENFSTLVGALETAGLVETLSGEGPFTVFAPTNAAFEALPEGTLDALVEDPSGDLTDVLLLHVVPGEFDSSLVAVAAADSACVLAGVLDPATQEGGRLRVAEADGGFTIGAATITTTDIEASNGIVHVIDAVITEPSPDCPV